MSLTVVVGAPFSGKRLWIDRQIAAAESAGTVGTLALDFTSLYSAIVPGLDSVFRDQRITDSGAARFAGWLLSAAVREANTRELPGYVAVDSPRRAVQAARELGGAPVVEVTVSQETALRRSQQHVDLIRDLAPRAGAEDSKEAAAKCRQMVKAYYSERGVLGTLPTVPEQVTAPDLPSDNAIRYMWSAAIRAAKSGDEAKRDKWTAAAKRALAARGVTA